MRDVHFWWSYRHNMRIELSFDTEVQNRLITPGEV